MEHLYFNIRDLSEDSGCVNPPCFEMSSFGNNSQILLASANYAETPTTTSTFGATRKRKISDANNKPPHPISEIASLESPAMFETSNLLCSTLNESLTRSLENFNLSEHSPALPTTVTPVLPQPSYSNFINLTSKKIKYSHEDIDEPYYYKPKPRSAPSTPTKHLDDDINDESHINPFRFPSDPPHYTPNKKRLYVAARGPPPKLGSPERLALLYPKIRLTGVSPRLKTPEKLREFVKRINSPAKKRLFDKPAERNSASRLVKRADPFNLLTVKNDMRPVVTKILEYLSDGDLCTVSKVSKLWKRVLAHDYKAYSRFSSYTRNSDSNKENVYDSFEVFGQLIPPCSPPRYDNFSICTKIASQLLPNQSLQKCSQCMSPAVLQRTISQCQNPNCSYISCTKCLSFSTRGPEHFFDKCNSAELITNLHKVSRDRLSLNDMSNDGSFGSGGTYDLPSFFYDTPHSRQYDSSGYYSMSETNVRSSPSPVIVQRAVPATGAIKTKKVLQDLKNVNRCEPKTAHHRARTQRSSLVRVVSPTKPNSAEAAEPPPSPPRVKLVACSKQSKKNLRRLQL